jgi:hypothetical protein
MSTCAVVPIGGGAMTDNSSILPYVLPDVPALDIEQDKLDFKDYAYTLRDIILNPNTETPLTIGIFGSWGSGKTSLMRMIESELKGAARRRGSTRWTYTIWFNAWLYSKEEILWRALIMHVLAGVRQMKRISQSIKKELDALADQLSRATASLELGSISMTASDLLGVEGTDNTRITLALQYGLDLLGQVAQTQPGDPVTTTQLLLSHVRQKAMTLEQERVESLEKFQNHFKKMMKYVLRRGCLVIFVDDLDRCLPDKAIEVLEAIKVFLDVPGCIFALGIDRDVIERGIHLRYGELGRVGSQRILPLLLGRETLQEDTVQYRAFSQAFSEGGRTLIDGKRYLEKIIQIPFVLPPISRDAMKGFIADLASNLFQEESRDILAEGLDPNPRQVKRAINIFTLLWELSRKRKDLAALVTPVRLAKLVVIQQRHPDIYDLLREAPEQLTPWEAFFHREQDWAGFAVWVQRQGLSRELGERFPEELAAYDHLPALKSLLTMHSLTTAGASFVDLTADQMRTFVFLTHAARLDFR